MKPEQFIGFFDDPGCLSSSSAAVLDEIVREYPFCQPAQLLYLKGLQNDENIRFNRQLKIAAAYASDRKVFIELMNIPKHVDNVTDIHYVPITDMDLLLFDFPTYAREDRPEIQAGNMASKKPSDELIDRFIGNPLPRILRPDKLPVSDKDVSLNSLKEDDEYLTETLARIYVQQGYFLKAIEAFEKLSLKIPEKSIYFASQIEMVRELIKNQ